MEDKNKELLSKQNGVTNGLTAKILSNTFSWHVNITKIDLSARSIETLDDKVKLPTNLVELNLSHNKLEEVPAVVLCLEKLKSLNLSHNAIQYFDETPSFCHSLELLDISTNSLCGPPYWIWTVKPKHLVKVNLSGNFKLTESFIDGYLEELLQYKTLVTDIDLYNCRFKNLHTKLLSTFSDVKTLTFGTDDYSYGSNTICEVPNESLRQCCAIEKLNLMNTHVYTIDSEIDIFINLRELNLGSNNIYGLPNEFCNLSNLETCVLSCNKLLYLPTEMYKLAKLVKLCLDSNELCMLPEKLLEMPNLKILDLYDNHLHESLDGYLHLEELDVAQNYMDEPDSVSYLERKEKLRLIYELRSDGRKPEVIQPDTEYSSTESEDEEYYRAVLNGEIPPKESQNQEPTRSRSSSPEDWDSDAHWVPHDIKYTPPTNPWVNFIKKKMHDGNFCPIDAHVVSISEQVLYEKQLYKQIDVECIGQFEDYSGDES